MTVGFWSLETRILFFLSASVLPVDMRASVSLPSVILVYLYVLVYYYLFIFSVMK